MASVNYWIKAAVTTITDSHKFLVSLATGAADVITWASLKALIKTWIQGEALTFTGSVKVKVSTDNLEPTQKIYVDNLNTENIKRDGSVAFTGKQTIDGLGLQLQRTETVPEKSDDDFGTVKQLIADDDNLYFKTVSGGWKKVQLNAF